MSSCRFKENDEVLVSYEKTLYDAKIIQTKLRDGVWRYYVHYVGWNASHDQWVGDERVRERNKENLHVQKQLRHGRLAAVTPARDHSRSTEVAQPPLTTPKETQLPVKTEKVLPIQVFMPRALRQQLIANRELVKNKQLTKVPKSPNVDDILATYQEQTKNSQVAMLNGLRQLFNRALEPALLYHEERSQYEKMMLLDSTLIPSTVYGAEHFLRLFVNLSKLLEYKEVAEDELCNVESEINNIVRFMEKYF